MIVLFWRSLLALASFGLVSSFVFLSLAIIAAVRFKKHSDARLKDALSFPADQLPPVTIFKPVHGMEERLEQNLES
ncbi:MAG TPA: hypothetical protein VIG91_07550, partial [Terriglobales bacterium]